MSWHYRCWHHDIGQYCPASYVWELRFYDNVLHWAGHHGRLGGWEFLIPQDSPWIHVCVIDTKLRGRMVYWCFDSALITQSFLLIAYVGDFM